MASIKKTNAMRLLDKDSISYEVREYEYDENDLDGHHVADSLGLGYEEVYKTLVAKGESGQYYVFCLSVDDEVALRKLRLLLRRRELNSSTLRNFCL